MKKELKLIKMSEHTPLSQKNNFNQNYRNGVGVKWNHINNQEALIEIRDLVIGFGSGRKQVNATKGVNLDILKGETFGLVGESGSGKTTIGRAIMGIQPVTSGTISYNGNLIYGKVIDLVSINKKIYRNINMIKLNQNTTTDRLNLYIEEFKRVFYKYVEGKRYNFKTQQVEEYEDDKERIILEGVNLKKTKLSELTVKDSNLKFVSDSITDNLKRVLKTMKLQKQISQFLIGLSEKIDIDKAQEGILLKYHKRVESQILEIKDELSEIKLALDAMNAIRAGFKKGEYNSVNKGFKDLGTQLENVVQKHKNITEHIAEAKRRQNSNIDLVENDFNLKQKRINTIRERILKNQEVKNFDRVNELKEVLDVISNYPNIQWIIENCEIFKNPTKKERHNLKKEMQMIFQDPASSLNDHMAVQQIISEGLDNFPEVYKNDQAKQTYIDWLQTNSPEQKIEISKIKSKDVKRFLIQQLLQTVGMLPEHLSRYPHEFSGGQRQRIGIARALIMKPKFVVADEPISALDVSIRAQVMNLLALFQKEFDLTYLFIAHDLSVVRFVANRIAVIYRGDIVELAEADELFYNPLHPYTKALLSAIPLPDPEQESKKVHITYDPEIEHFDYSFDFPSFREVSEGHYIFANNRETKIIQRNLKGGK